MQSEVLEIDWKRHQIVTLGERVWPIVALFDRQGLPLLTPAGAVIAFAGDQGCWFTFVLQDFDPRALQ